MKAAAHFKKLPAEPLPSYCSALATGSTAIRRITARCSRPTFPTALEHRLPPRAHSLRPLASCCVSSRRQPRLCPAFFEAEWAARVTHAVPAPPSPPRSSLVFPSAPSDKSSAASCANAVLIYLVDLRVNLQSAVQPRRPPLPPGKSPVANEHILVTRSLLAVPLPPPAPQTLKLSSEPPACSEADRQPASRPAACLHCWPTARLPCPSRSSSAPFSPRAVVSFLGRHGGPQRPVATAAAAACRLSVAPLLPIALDATHIHLPAARRPAAVAELLPRARLKCSNIESAATRTCHRYVCRMDSNRRRKRSQASSPWALRSHRHQHHALPQYYPPHPGHPPPGQPMNMANMANMGSAPFNAMRYPLPPNGGDQRVLSGGRHKKEIKRRTKTGCLTCRKRRIKVSADLMTYHWQARSRRAKRDARWLFFP